MRLRFGFVMKTFDSIEMFQLLLSSPHTASRTFLILTLQQVGCAAQEAGRGGSWDS